MSQGRVHSWAGANRPREVTSAATLSLKHNDYRVWLTGTATVTSIVAETRDGRPVEFFQNGAGVTTFTNTDSSTTAGQMDLGGGNVVLGRGQSVSLMQDANGVWRKLWTTEGGGGGGAGGFSALTAATTLSVPNGTVSGSVTGTATVTSISTALQPGQKLTLYGISGTCTFTNTNGTSTEGQMDLGGQNYELSTAVTLELIQRADGSWLRTGGRPN